MFTAKQALWAILFGSPFTPYSSAQNVVETHRNCGSMAHLAEQTAQNPEIKTRRAVIEAQTFDYLRRASPESAAGVSASERTVITIPVVVHVLYSNARENISDAQIMSQIDALNRDFRKTNAESANIPAIFRSVAADVGVEFCLARRQPNGLPTTGIERLISKNSTWKANDDMKRASKDGLETWDASKYLNIWVCALGGGALGYATFPGSPLSTDGVVIDYRYFGTFNTRSPFNLGRTATHEVGHWMNLYHIWGDANCGDDLCADTPPHHGANYGCPTFPFVQTNCGGSNTEMTMNYMDYTNDACMYMFTNAQKARMTALFAVGGARRSIVESNACGALPPPPSVCAAPTNFFYSTITAQSATVNWTASASNATFTIEYRRTSDVNWTSAVNLTTNPYVINDLLPQTFYQVRLRAICANAVESEYSAILTFQTLQKIIIPPPPPISDCEDKYEPNNLLSAAYVIPTNVKTTGLISDARDRDWFLIKTPSNTSLSIKLSRLPADYDMRLFDNRLRLVGSSENQGLSDESVKYKTQSGQDFMLLYIYGYNGTFNADKCYTIEVSASSKAVASITPLDSVSGFRVSGFKKDGYTEGVVISPNPTTGMLTIELPTNNGTTIQVYSSLGQLLLDAKNQNLDSANRCAIDLSAAPNGIYLVKIEQEGRVWVKKVFKN